MLSDRIHLGPDPLLSHSRVMALQLTWLHWCNTDKSETNISPVRSDQAECERSCGDGNKSCTQRGLHFPFGLVNGEAFFLHTLLVWSHPALKSPLELLLTNESKNLIVQLLLNMECVKMCFMKKREELHLYKGEIKPLSANENIF